MMRLRGPFDERQQLEFGGAAATAALPLPLPKAERSRPQCQRFCRGASDSESVPPGPKAAWQAGGGGWCVSDCSRLCRRGGGVVKG